MTTGIKMLWHRGRTAKAPLVGCTLGASSRGANLSCSMADNFAGLGLPEQQVSNSLYLLRHLFLAARHVRQFPAFFGEQLGLVVRLDRAFQACSPGSASSLLIVWLPVQTLEEISRIVREAQTPPAGPQGWDNDEYIDDTMDAENYENSGFDEWRMGASI